MGDPQGEGYLFANAAPQAERRFQGLGTAFNHVTFAHIERLGIADGWRCWEVGVGGPSIPMWLSDRVGPTGSVVATDIDARWVREPIAPNVEVLEHDVAEDEPPEGPFDLVHERLVLIHVPARDRAVRRMAGALRPGGWILVEDYDTGMQSSACPDPRSPIEELANRIRGGMATLLRGRGSDGGIGRRLPNMLRDAGMVDVGAEGYLPLAVPVNNEIERVNIDQVRDGLLAQELATAEEVDTYLAALADRTVEVSLPILISAWGRRPD